MWPVLIRIPIGAHLPDSLGGWPLFGFGVVSAAWLVWTIVRATLEFRTAGQTEVATSNLINRLILLGVFVALPFVLPQEVVQSGIPIFGYGASLVTGFLVASWIGSVRAKRQGLDPNVIWDVGLLILFTGVLGARLFFIITHPQQFFHPGLTLPQILFGLVNLPDGGLVLYGGVILAGFAFWRFCKQRQIPVLDLGDILITSIFVGEAFGRVGCFLYGCCYGDPCTLPWAVQFPAGSVPYRAQLAAQMIDASASASLPIHPTQIYSTLNALALAIITWNYYPMRSRSGEVLLLGWILYPITRYVIEILRGDTPGEFGTSLTNAQWVSIGMLIAAGIFASWLYRKPAMRPTASSTPHAPAGSA